MNALSSKVIDFSAHRARRQAERSTPASAPVYPPFVWVPVFLVPQMMWPSASWGASAWAPVAHGQ